MESAFTGTSHLSLFLADQSSPHYLTLFLEDLLLYYPTMSALVFQMVSCLHVYPKPSLLSLIRATCPAHLLLLDLIERRVYGEQSRSWSTSLWCTISSISVLLHHPSAQISSSAPYSRTTSAYAFPSVWKTKTTRRSMVVQVLVCILLESKREDKVIRRQIKYVRQTHELYLFCGIGYMFRSL